MIVWAHGERLRKRFVASARACGMVVQWCSIISPACAFSFPFRFTTGFNLPYATWRFLCHFWQRDGTEIETGLKWKTTQNDVEVISKWSRNETEVPLKWDRENNDRKPESIGMKLKVKSGIARSEHQMASKWHRNRAYAYMSTWHRSGTEAVQSFLNETNHFWFGCNYAIKNFC